MVQKITIILVLILNATLFNKLKAQNYVLDSIINQQIEQHFNNKHFSLLQNEIQSLNDLQHRLDINKLYYAIISNLELANITDTQCVFYQSAKKDIKKYIQLSMSIQDESTKSQIDYIKALQFNIFKEGFSFDLFSKMESYKAALQAFNSKNTKTAYKNLELAFELENPYAMLLMGDIWANNEFEDKESSIENALNFYELAAENKLAIAIPTLIFHLKKHNY